MTASLDSVSHRCFGYFALPVFPSISCCVGGSLLLGSRQCSSTTAARPGVAAPALSSAQSAWALWFICTALRLFSLTQVFLGRCVHFVLHSLCKTYFSLLYLDSSVAWIICARGGLQFCHPKSRDVPDVLLITPIFAAQDGPPLPLPPHATAHCILKAFNLKADFCCRSYCFEVQTANELRQLAKTQVLRLPKIRKV